VRDHAVSFPPICDNQHDAQGPFLDFLLKRAEKVLLLNSVKMKWNFFEVEEGEHAYLRV
jgi:hypothetical protein